MFELAKYNDYVLSLYKKMIGYSAIADKLSSIDNWTIRNNVSHLIDSASNNHQRFIRLQLAQKVELPGYDAEPWTEVSGIKNMPYLQLVEFWKLYNIYLIEVISNIKEENLHHEWINSADKSACTLEFLVTDYFEHLKLHEKMIDDIANAIKGNQ